MTENIRETRLIEIAWQRLAGAVVSRDFGLMWRTMWWLKKLLQERQ